MKKEWRTAFSANASTVGLLSGRIIVMFYSQMEGTSWMGVMTAAVLFGVVCGGACVLANKTGTQNLADAAMRLLGIKFGLLTGALAGIAAAAVGTVMLCESGKLAALSLSVHNAREMGMLCALGTALLLNMNRMRRFPGFGMAAVTVSLLFYAALALDGRQVHFPQRFETVARLSGSMSAALMFSCMHASMCALVSADVVMRRAYEVNNVVIFSLKCSGTMFLMLFAANSALLRGGTKLLSLGYPEAALAARWGKMGFFLCILSKMMQNISSLSACIAAFVGSNAKHDKKNVLNYVI